MFYHELIKKGNFTWTHYANGIVNHYGDGSGDLIKIRTTKDFSEIKLLLNPSLQFGEILYEWLIDH